MKKIFARTRHTKVIAAASALTWTIAMAHSAGAAQLKEARVTQVVNDVKLLLEQAAPRPAAVSDLVRRGNAVRTGTQSRSELTFADLTITRLGANTIFSFKEGTREMNLIDGAILFQVPKGSGGATIRTVGVTAAITGTTGIAEFHPATTSHPQLSKWLCLEGTFHLYLPNGQSVELGPGKMVTADGKSFSKVSTFDIAKLVSTSLFFNGFDQPLASMNLIMLESENQMASLLATSTTNPLDPARIVNVTSQAIAAEETPTSPAASPTPPITPTPPVTPTPPPPTPSKFGTPSVISSPAPYLITNGTVITTDPSITTNGVTDYGKIYRGQTEDGAFSLWAFGSTSVFDTALRIDDTFFADPSHLPIAVFKFESLSLTGDPTIDTSHGVPKLALIGVDGITSGPPGGTLKFTGLDLLLLATVNGSINLTSDVSFQDLHELAMYARGVGSDLTINSPISNIAILGLVAQDSIHLTNPGTMSVGKLDAVAGGDLMLQIGGSLVLDGRVRLDAIVLPGASVASGANLTLNVAGDYTNNSATESSRLAITNRDHIGTGGNINVSIGGDLTASGLGGGTGEFEAGDFALVVQNTNGQIDNGGNLNLSVNGNVQVNGLAAYVQNYDGTANPGHIGTGGNIDVEIGGNLTASSYVDVFLNNRGGGMIDSGGNLTFNVSGGLTIGADAITPGFSAEFIVSTRYDDIAGNTMPSTIGSDVSLYLHAASIDMAGALFGSGISNRGGSVIDGNATVTWDVPGNVNIQGTGPNTIGGLNGANWWVLNDIPPDHHLTTPSGGTIHGNATLTLNIGGDLTIAGDGSIEIANHRNFQEQGSSGGTIDSDATLNITTANFSTGGELDVFVINRNNGSGSGTGGTIGGNAAINLNLSGNLATTGTDPNSAGTPGLASIGIFNGGFVAGSPGGFISGDATIAVSATNVSTANNLDVEIENQGDGHIGGNAIISLSAAGDINAQGDASFQIFDSSAGTIGGDAAISLNAGSVSTAGNMNVSVFNGGGGTIGGDAMIGVTAANISVGTPLAPANLGVFIDNTSGTIGGSVATNLTVSGDITVAGAINAFLNNGGATSSPGSHVTGGATINVLGTTGINAGNGAFFAIVNEDAGAGTFGGTIDGNALVRVTADHLSTEALAPSDFNLFGTIHNRGGSIVGNSDVMFDISGAITTGGRASFDILNFDDGGSNGGGMIGGNARVSINASALSIDGELLVDIQNQNAGTINGNGNVSLSVGGSLTATDLNIFINNFNTGTIGGDAAINVTANNMSTGGSLSAAIDNSSGLGNGFIGSTIGGDASINITAANLTANSLLAQIDNTGGSIGGNTEGGAMINMNVSNSATVANDATVAIYGSDGAVGGAGININGGNYNVGGTFLSYIDGNGTITFNNASAHADVLKAGVFGANGVLNIGGGTLSADTTLKLYAPGSNGQLNFISNVTLGGNSVKILAANSITIFNNVVVTIGGSKPADVYTGFTDEVPNANYTGFGGNGSTTGTFGGAGANDPQPIEKAPPFDNTNRVTSSGKPRGGGKATDTTINVSNSDELLALLNDAHPGRDGRIRIPDSKRASHGNNASRFNAVADVNAHRRAMDRRTASIPTTRRLPQ